MKNYITKLTFASSVPVKDFFKSRYIIPVLVKFFSHALDLLQHGAAVLKKLNVFW